MSGGRERRRKGLINHIRRSLYGLFLTSTWLQGHAAEPPKAPKLMKPVAPRVSWSAAEEVAPVRAGAVTYYGTDDLPRHPHRSLLGDEPQFLTVRFNMDAASMIRSGVDIDLNLVGVATLHLKVASEEGSGRRFHFASGSSEIRNPGRACSITGLVDVVAVSPQGDRQLVFIPQVNVALDTMFGAPDGMTAAVRYSHWSAGPETDKGIVGSRVPQVYVRWSF